MPVNPKTAAIIEIRKNISVHFNNDMSLPAGRFDAADQQFQRALARAPANAWSYFGLAELYKARGNTAAANQAEADLARTWISDRRLLQISNL